MMRRYTFVITFLLALLLVVGPAGASGHLAPLSYVLTDSATSHSVDAFSLTSEDVPFESAVGWSVRKETLRGGKQEGVEIVTIDNGVLQIVVIPTRGMNVFEVRKGDVRLGWDSPVKEIVHPKFINLESRGGLGWLEGFNESMVRCGLEYAGHAGQDSFVNNTGDTATMDLTLHGKIGNIPASKVEVLVDAEPPHRIRVRGVVHERLFFGPKLRLVAEISTVPGSDTYMIEDTVSNLGAAEQEYQLIYHGNYGSSIMEAGAEVVVAAASVAPMNATAAKGVKKYNQYEPPTPGFLEEVYLLEPYVDDDGYCMALLKNANGTLGTSVRWRHAELPYFTLWKNSVPFEEGYVTGLEPGTGHPFNRRVERKYGRVPKLGAGESVSFSLEFGIHEGLNAVDGVEEAIERIQDGRDIAIIADPPNTD